jgi:diguanylate cyclase (GGDEF)-like protein
MQKDPSSLELKISSENDAKALFKEKLNAMQDKFKASLPARFAEIQQAWERVQAASEIEDDLDVLYRLVHTLTGSAGTFGYQQLSRDSRALEILLKGLVSHADINYDEHRLQIQEMIYGLVKVTEGGMESALSQQLVRNTGKHERKNNILIVEDDKALNELLTLELQHFGYEVASVKLLEDLPASVETFRPDLILADITFPGDDFGGIQAVKSVLEQYSEMIDLPVIFMSARQDIEARLQAVRAKGQAYFLKPVNLSALLNQIREMTNRIESEPYQVVVVDDDPALVSLITFILEEYGMHVASVTDPKLVLEVIGRHKPDLILMDVHMPWCNGIELAQVIRQHHDLSMIPIIFLSSETDENIQFQAVLKGGDDFLSKPIDINKLPKFIQSRAQRARSVNSLMIRDGLTGLFNHTYIKQAVETEMNRLERNGTEFSVVMMDVDFFKKVNDTYGHIAGDQVLRSLSHFLVQHLRKTDKVGRYGGEEFMVVLPETTLEDAVSVMQTILDKFGEIIHHSAENDFHITFSAGVISSRVTQDIEVMLENVDKGLYKAKNNGRNQVTAIKKLIE